MLVAENGAQNLQGLGHRVQAPERSCLAALASFAAAASGAPLSVSGKNIRQTKLTVAIAKTYSATDEEVPVALKRRTAVMGASAPPTMPASAKLKEQPE